jgi:hypothetical protein
MHNYFAKLKGEKHSTSRKCEVDDQETGKRRTS